MKWAQSTWIVHGQRENFALGTQHDLYYIGSRWGFALPVTQILVFLDTNMLIYPKQNSRVGGITQRKPPMPGVLRCSGI